MPDPHTHLPAGQQEWPSLDPADRPLVVVHAAGPDGWACEFLFRRHFGANADYMQARYGDPVPDVTPRPWVYIADFSWPADEMESMAAACGGRLTLIDHHKTAASAVARLAVSANIGVYKTTPKVVFDLEHSGAVLTWQYLKDAGATDPVFATHEPPLIVQYVQDRDLWKWELPESKEINAALASYPKTVEDWTALHGLVTSVAGGGYWRLVREGEAILRRQDQEVQAAVARAVEMDIAGHRVLVVNTTCYHSEIGERLSAGRPFAATYFDDLKRNLRIWSFRSREGGIDVSEIARRFGGGGHRQAAGAQQSLHEPISGMSGIPAYNQETQITLAT